MQEKLKEIVSVFIKVPPAEIGPATPIDRSAVQSSILLHRMFARLAEEGIAPEDYSMIKVFGDLSPAAPVASGTPVAAAPFTMRTSGNGADAEGLGIDIEETAAMPRTTDFRKEGFYTLNFSAEEIAYCILQADPYVSFTGLFAAKEAIVKAGGRRRGEPFHTIRITHSPEGRPLYPGFAISISHTPGLAVAAATHRPMDQRYTASHAVSTERPDPAMGGRGMSGWVAWIGILLGIIALLVALTHHA
ncbi:MAG TPA: 4'-phosphopantetheinyl transferase superfamily protein [Puia sp.]|nr:4'-phosphopantetheinyl transferase superfamily protein [Puia sp.]